MRKFNLKALMITTIVLLTPTIVSANGVNLDTGTGLQPINIPLFSSSALDFVENASVLSWLAFAGGVFTVLIVAFWIVRILLSGVEALRSEGDQTKLQESYAKLKSNFIGMFITFLVPLVLSLIGALFGIGTIFDWPQSFQFCNNTEYRFYFEAYLKAGEAEAAKDLCGI